MSVTPGLAQLNPPIGEQDNVQGLPDAVVTLVEYGDFECGSCGLAYPIVKAIQAEFGDQLRFAFRHFPLTAVHPNAEKAAEAAEAAGAQGHFWQMHDMLFEHQSALEFTHLLMYAEAIGLDMTNFTQEMEAGIHMPRVRSDFNGGARCGVNATPTFFINGIRHDLSWDEPVLRSAIMLAAEGQY